MSINNKNHYNELKLALRENLRKRKNATKHKHANKTKDSTNDPKTEDKPIHAHPKTSP